MFGPKDQVPSEFLEHRGPTSNVKNRKRSISKDLVRIIFERKHGMF